MSKSYIDKLKDPRWQKKRLEILQRDNWTCQECKDTENTLHVHHRTYEFGKNPWEYEENNFITLCADCHESEERQKKEYEPLFLNTFYKAGFMADDLREFASGFHKMKLQATPRIVAEAFAYAISLPEFQSYILKKHKE